MLEYLPSQDDVIAVHIAGHMSKEELEALVTRVETSLAANEQTHLYVEASGFAGLDLDAVGDYLPRAWHMLRERERFGRIAVVSEQAWLRWATKLESALIPGLSYETFLPHERDRALAWVKGEHLQPHAPAIRIIETDKPGVIGFELDGKLTTAEIEATAAYFDAALASSQPLRVLGRIRRIGGFELGGLFNRSFIDMKLGVLRRLERYALVGAPDWLQAWARGLAPLANAEILCFDAEEEELAWSWLGAEPVGEKALVD